MGLTELIALAAFLLPFAFVYRLLVKLQASDHRYDGLSNSGGDVLPPSDFHV